MQLEPVERLISLNVIYLKTNRVFIIQETLHDSPYNYWHKATNHNTYY
jgi:hypothetical protein